MLKLTAKVFDNRNYLGSLEVHGGPAPHDCELVAKSAPGLAIADPLPGAYTMKKIELLPEHDTAAIAQYGRGIIFFEPASRRADRGKPSGSAGGLLALHGGMTDGDGRLLPTRGSLRVPNDALEAILGMLKGGQAAILNIREEKIGFFKRLFAPRIGGLRPDADTSSFFDDRDTRWAAFSHTQADRSDADRPDDAPSFFGGGGSGGGGASRFFDGPADRTATEKGKEAADMPVIADPFSSPGSDTGDMSPMSTQGNDDTADGGVSTDGDTGTSY